jgi:hypothetical protein
LGAGLAAPTTFHFKPRRKLMAGFIGTFIERPTKTKNEALAALDAMTDDELNKAFDLLFGGEEDGELVRDTLRRTVTEFYDDVVHGFNYDVDEWTVNGQQIIVTGGTAMGDEPNDAYRLIEAMHVLGVTS